jgi:cysteine-rich repeat protein
VIPTTHPAGAGERPPRPQRCGRVGLAAALLLACLVRADSARAHGTPVDLAFWGDFPPAVAACQRAIGSAAAACGLQTWRLQRQCGLDRLRGVGCDETAVDNGVQAARRAAQNVVTAACTTAQVSQLQFLGTFEAGMDVNTFCRDLQTAATSLLLDPLPAAPASAAALACVNATLRSVAKLFGASFRSRRRLLDRIAIGAFPPPRKRLMRDASTADIAAAATALQGEIDRSCAADTFSAFFRQTPAEVLAKLSTRADCLAGQTYAQGGILCPAPVCGNRMIERDEECDDGNAASGDGCNADCLTE